MKEEKKETLTDDNMPSPDDVECDTSGLERQIVELNDKYLRAMAELENLRRRAAIDADAAARARAGSIAENFLPLIDAIGAATCHHPDDEDFISFARAASGVLDKVGIKKIETVGQPLNPLLHNAIQTEESDAESGIITQEFQAGYMFGDAVLRPAMVIVAK
ncbi:MAG: nucleotide exchange factor GrpE [Alphaproteobacteria bacterium]|nr:nucleotide exchange factor GrpE [Alphaproteobacteria bacterium]